MTAQQLSDANYAHADSAFEPQSGFDFADGNDSSFPPFPSLSQLGEQYGIMSSQGVPGSQQDQSGGFGAVQDHFPPGTAAFTHCTAANDDINPSHVWALGNSPIDTPHMRPSAQVKPISTQDDIIESRHQTAAQRFGQVTPPEDASVPDFRPREGGGSDDPSKPSKPAKMDKSQRARNAAVSRHSKARLQRAMNAEASIAESGSPEVEDKKERYREKNRQAAAKCRQKKKENTDDLESKHRTLSAHNSFLKNEVRQLRDQLVELRMQALPHHDSDPRCNCTGLHHFNRAQAKRLTETASLGQFGFDNSPTTISEGNDSQAPSPRSSMSDRINSLPRVHNAATAMPPRPASFAAPSSYGVGQATAAESMEDCRSTAGSLDTGMLFFGNMQDSSSRDIGGLRSSPIDSQREYDGFRPSPGPEGNSYGLFQPPAGTGYDPR